MSKTIPAPIQVKDPVKKYECLRPKYQSFAEVVRLILNEAISDNCNVHSIEIRAKTIDSFKIKAEKTDEKKQNQLKYTDPLSQITDLAGARVIVFFPKALSKIREIIEEQFNVDSIKDLGQERFMEGNFGYQSIHYLVKLPEGRTELVEYKQFDGLIAEIQVRTILQHAWAEMEHDIQYKSSEQTPSTLQRRFTALAGMLEIADREFQAIQDEDGKLRQIVRASLQDDLIETALNESSDSSQTFEESSIESSSPAVSSRAATHARELISSGNYSEAIEHYSQLISLQPDSYTIFIGRAKARFLSGDRYGAISDLDTAEKLHPNDTTIENLKNQIEDGVLTSNATAEAWQLSTSGNKHLAKGEGEEAFKMYSKAQALGFRPNYSTFNKAMACALTKDADGANYFLNQFVANFDSPMEINALALRSIVSFIGKTGYAKNFQQLKGKLIKLRGFDFNQSPLRHLEKGFSARDTNPANEIAKVFETLKKKEYLQEA